MTIKDRIKRCREQAGLTPGELAKAVGVSDVAVYYWEQGKTEPKHTNIERIAKACGLSIAAFWSDPPKGKARAS